jgi:hypothetical protein
MDKILIELRTNPRWKYSPTEVVVTARMINRGKTLEETNHVLRLMGYPPVDPGTFKYYRQYGLDELQAFVQAFNRRDLDALKKEGVL